MVEEWFAVKSSKRTSKPSARATWSTEVVEGAMDADVGMAVEATTVVMADVAAVAITIMPEVVDQIPVNRRRCSKRPLSRVRL